MKRIACTLLLFALVFKASAQDTLQKKPATLAFHAFYNDFKTAQQMRTTSLGNTTWSGLGDMQMGFGFNYLRGISPKIDWLATLDASGTDYLFKDGSTNGSSKLLLDANAGLNFKLLTDRHTLSPYLLAGAGVSMYGNKLGVYIPIGAGLQVNLFNQAFVFTGMQYRRAITSAVNDHLQYQIGIGTSIGKKKTPKPLPPQAPISQKAVEPVGETPVVAAPVVVPIHVKDLLVIVIDSLTGVPLSGVAVTVNGQAGEFKGFTDVNGRVAFSGLQAADFKVSGTLNGVNTTTKLINRGDFDIPTEQIKINLSHNDLRFTLAGRVSNKSTGQPEAGVSVTVSNITQSTSQSSEDRPGDGTFKIQLEPGSEFTVLGKKAGYISNIEKVSTKGLVRSTTLYVNLELGIEQATPDKTIKLSNIYYDSGSTKIRTSASADLEKLIQFLKDNPVLKIEIASHTDSRGNKALNLRLSNARALAIVEYLIKNGIEKSRLSPRGYGSSKLVNGCTVGVKCTAAQDEENRRTEFKVIELTKKP